MNLFRKNKKKSVTIKTISPGAQIRKIIYDSGVKEPEIIAEILGLMPRSNDVAEMEEKASDKRVSKLAPILPLIEMHSMISAQISAMTYFASAVENGGATPDEEVFDAMTLLFKHVSFSAAVSCMAALVDLDVIKEGYLNEQ